MLRYAASLAMFMALFALASPADAGCNCEFERTFAPGDEICSQKVIYRGDTPDPGYGRCVKSADKCVRAPYFEVNYQCDCDKKTAAVAETACQMVGDHCMEVPVGGGAIVSVACDKMIKTCFTHYETRDKCGTKCDGSCRATAHTDRCPGTTQNYLPIVFVPGVCKSCEASK